MPAFSASVGGTGTTGRQKLSLFLPKRKKTMSQSSGTEEHESTGGEWMLRVFKILLSLLDFVFLMGIYFNVMFSS